MVENLVEYVLRFGVLSCIGLLVLGVLWAPIGGVVVAKLSSSREGVTEISFGQAASASLLLFLPWLYLLLQTLGKAPGKRVIKRSFIAFFLLWLLGTVGVWLSVSLNVVFFLDAGELGRGTRSQMQLSFFAIIFLVVNIIMVYLPTRRLLRPRPQSQGSTSFDSQPTIPQDYLSAFKYAFWAFILSPVFIAFYGVLLLANRQWE